MQSVMLTNFREDGILHVELLNLSETTSIVDALEERIDDFNDEITDRWRDFAPRFRFSSRRRKPRPTQVLDMGNVLVVHNDDLLVAYDRDIPTLIDIFIRSPAGIAAAQQSLRDLVDHHFIR